MNRPLVCVSLRGRTAAEVVADFSHAKSLGAEMVEVRLDNLWLSADNSPNGEESGESEQKAENLGLEDVDLVSSLSEITEAIDLPIILACRSINQGGFFPGNEDSRTEALKLAIGTNPSWIDLEIDIPPKIRANLVDSLGEGTKVIASVHYLDKIPSSSQIVQEIEDSASLGELIKVCIKTKSRTDGFRIFEAALHLRESDIKTAVMGLGPGGDWTRIHAPLLEQSLVYTTTEYDPYLAQKGRINISDLQMAWSMLEYS